MLSPCGEIVRAGDPDRFRTALFAPPEKREHLFALYAFNLEIAKIAPMVSEPMLGEIRLQWWREALDQIYGDDPVRKHEVTTPLAEAVRAADLPRAPFDALIDARGSDLDPAFPADAAALKDYLRDTGGSLALLASNALGGADEKESAVVIGVGTAIAVARYVQAIPKLRGQGNRTIAYEPYKFKVLENNPKPGTVKTQSDPNLSKAIRELAVYGLERLTNARGSRTLVSKKSAPALLEARLADKILRHHSKYPMRWREAPRSSPRLLWAGATGRW